MKNLNALWTQLVTSFSSSSSGSANLGVGGDSISQPSPPPLSTAKSSNHFSANSHSHSRSLHSNWSFLSRLVHGHPHRHRQYSEPPTRIRSISTSSSITDSSSSGCSSFVETRSSSFCHQHNCSHQLPNNAVPLQLDQQHRAVSCNQLIGRSVSLPRDRRQPSAIAPASAVLPGRYQHPKFCQCHICQLHERLRSHEVQGQQQQKQQPNSIDIITEEEDVHSEEEQRFSGEPEQHRQTSSTRGERIRRRLLLLRDTTDCIAGGGGDSDSISNNDKTGKREQQKRQQSMAASSKKQQQQKQLDKVVPFQKAEKLAEHLWQQAPAGLLNSVEEPDVIKRTPHSSAIQQQQQHLLNPSDHPQRLYCPNHRYLSRDNVSKLSVPTTVMMNMDNHNNRRTRQQSRSPSPDDHHNLEAEYHLDGEGRSRSSASAFLRSHHLRSSCPPPSRPRRRRSKTPTRSIAGGGGSSKGVTSSGYKQQQPDNLDSLADSEKLHHSSSTGGGGGLVEKVQSKLKLSSVRKSWLFSLFNGSGSGGHSSNTSSSKDKHSKWTRSDDFEAEFFVNQHHRELTENLISRRSPLIFNPPLQPLQQPPRTDSKRTSTVYAQQMSAPSGQQALQSASSFVAADLRDHHLQHRESQPIVVRRQSGQHQQQQQHTTGTTTTTSDGDSASAAGIFDGNTSTSFSTTSITSGPSRHSRARPRSACLDTYLNSNLLRMRNGNFIEFNVDNENDDESCSIISSAAVQQLIAGNADSHQQQLHSQLLLPPNSNNSNNSSSLLSTNQQYSAGGTSDSSNLSARNRRPASTVSDHWLQQHQPALSNTPTMTTITSINSATTNSGNLPTTATSSSSPLLPKRNKSTSVLTTTSSHSSATTTSSGVQMGSGSALSGHVTSSHSSPITSRSGGGSTVTIHWPVRNATEISFGPSSTAFDLITHFLTSQLYTKAPVLPTSVGHQQSPPHPPSITRYLHCYALRLICRELNPNDHQWLHPGQSVAAFVEQQRETKLSRGWRLELRIRYLPESLQALAEEDPVSFNYLYDQVLQEFLLLEDGQCLQPKYQDLIVELGCLELRRSKLFLTPAGLEKNSNFEALEGELGQFLPAAFIASMKSKQLRKLIKAKFKKIFALQQRTAMFELLRLVHQLVPYTREVFRVSLGDSAWSVPIDLTVGADSGMTYHTSSSSPPTVIVRSFEQIEQLSIVSHATMNRSSTIDRRRSRQIEGVGEQEVLQSGSPAKKILLNIRIHGEEDTLVISCASFAVATSLADLIDGYHRLATNSRTSVWMNNNAGSSSDTDSLKGTNSGGHNSLKSNASEVIEPRRAEVKFISPSPPPFPITSSKANFSTQQSTTSSTAHYSSIPNSQQQQQSSEQLNNNNNNNNNDYEADYSSPMEMCTEICRDRLTIEQQLIGTGQFGDVHRALYYPPPSVQQSSTSISSQPKEPEPIAVAVKISKMQTPGSLNSNGQFSHHSTSAFDYFSADQKLLCEAERMQQLEHEHIIRLIGVCSASPVYVVMELAAYGELRDFLAKHGPTLEHRHLIEYSLQIASALAYLESQQFVHRDIAARNILVFSFDVVKLADFGLSRYIEDASYYMATNSKLPIKWMAPESINFRRFTTASDVWMFAVCVWEIFMLGRKPFQGVKNVDVLGRIEGGERLAKPPRCPPALYALLLKCWKYEPDKRPSFRYVKRTIKAVAQAELGLVGAIARMDLEGSSVNGQQQQQQQQSSSPMSSLSSISDGGGANRFYSSSASSSLSRNFYAASNNKNSDLHGGGKSGSSPSSSLNASQVLDAQKIKAILSEQRKQMEADSKWLAENEVHWQQQQSSTSTAAVAAKNTNITSSGNRFDSLNSTTSTKSNSSSLNELNSSQHNHSGTATSSSLYEDADCGGAGSALCGKDHLLAVESLHRGSSGSGSQNHSTQSLNSSGGNHMYSVPNHVGKSSNQQKRISYGDESYNSFKSTTSLMGATTTTTTNTNTNTNTNSSCGSANLEAGHQRQLSSLSTSSSIDSAANDFKQSYTGSACGLSVSLKKFFKHNQLSDSKMRQEMMRQVNVYSSGQLDRTEDAVYSSTMEVINAVRQLLKGVQEVNTSEYVDLVKSVGQELRNLLANVDSLLATELLVATEAAHWTIDVAQKKLTADMNDLVEAMKRTIVHSDTLMEEAYKQSMLETTYVLVIDSKNLLDTVDEVRLQVASASSSTFEQVKSLEDYDRGMKTTDDDDEEETTTQTEPTPAMNDSLALKVVERVPLVSAFADTETEKDGDQAVYENTMTTTASSTSTT